MFSAKHNKNHEGPNHIKIGKFGEDKACEYLISKKYEILYRNVFEGFYEIDIVARDLSGLLIFFEVKTMRISEYSSQFLAPEDNLTSNKAKKIKKACELFVAKHPLLINEDLGWRMDLIAITLNIPINGQALINIRHYENI